MIDPFVTFEKYIAIKLTFDINNNYDFFDYGGKTRQKKETFLKRKDRYHFYALAKRLNNDEREIEAYLFINLLHNPEYWIGDMLDNECEERYKTLYPYQSSFTYAFSEESKKLKEYIDEQDIHFDRMLGVNHGIPKLMELVYAEEFTPMLLHGFNKVFRMIQRWNEHQEVFEPLLVEPMKRMMIFQNFAERYSHHLTKDQLSDILRKIFT